MSTNVTWPGGSTGATATTYAVPAAGELNWQALSDFLIALGNGAQATTFQKFAVRKATTTPVTVAAATDCIVVTDLSVAGAVAVNLPAGAAKQIFIVKDGKGDAATNNVTITPNGAETIGGAANLVLSTNGQSVILVYNSGDTDWKIVGNIISASFVNPMDSAGDMIYGGASGVATKLDAGTAGTWLVSAGAAAPTWTNTVTTGKVIDGTADENQLRIQGHATQTNDLLVVEKSDGTDLLQVTNTAGTLIRGTTTNTAMSAGFVGEVLQASRLNSAKVSLTTATAANVVNTPGGKLDLTAGIWSISGIVVFSTSGATVSQWKAAINTTSATMVADDVMGVPTNNTIGNLDNPGLTTASVDRALVIPPYEVRVNATTEFFLVAQASFSAGTVAVYGSMTARRVV